MADSKNKNTKKGKWLKGLITNYSENVRRKMLKCKYENSQYIKKIVVIVCSYITSLCRLMSLSYLSLAAVGSQDTRCFCLLWTLFFCFTENSVTSCSKEQTRKKTHTHTHILCICVNRPGCKSVWHNFLYQQRTFKVFTAAQTQCIDCPSSRGCCILIESSYEAVVLPVDISTLSPCPVSNPTAVLLSGPHPLEVHHHLQAAVGHSGRPLLLQLDLLHSPHAAAHVHERRAGLQYTAGELMSVMKGSRRGGRVENPWPIALSCLLTERHAVGSALPGLWAVCRAEWAVGRLPEGKPQSSHSQSQEDPIPDR